MTGSESSFASKNPAMLSVVPAAPKCPKCGGPTTRKERRSFYFVPSAGGDRSSYAFICNDPFCSSNQRRSYV